MMKENKPQLDDPQLSTIYKQTPQDLPPTHLDETILKTARKKSNARPINPFSNNWRVPASMAAVLIISVGIVTLMEVNVSPVNDTIERRHTASIAEDITPLNKSAAPDIAAMKLERSRMTQGLTAKQKNQPQKRQLSRAMQDSSNIELSSAAPALMAAPTDIASIKSISILRLAGKKSLANKQADKFIRHYFGNELNKVNPANVVLSTKDWKGIISELRKLDRESIATKLEKLLETRLEN